MCRQERLPKAKRRVPGNADILDVCAELLLHRNQNFNVMQRLVSLILHSGHAGKAVFCMCTRIRYLFV